MTRSAAQIHHQNDTKITLWWCIFTDPPTAARLLHPAWCMVYENGNLVQPQLCAGMNIDRDLRTNGTLMVKVTGCTFKLVMTRPYFVLMPSADLQNQMSVEIQTFSLLNGAAKRKKAFPLKATVTKNWLHPTRSFWLSTTGRKQRKSNNTIYSTHRGRT